MSRYRAPNGERIIGTLETLPSTVYIEGIDDGGFPLYAGGSSIHWDDQTPKTRDGKIIFLCDSGQEWTFDQLTKVADDK
jgi:hypothetical protein